MHESERAFSSCIQKSYKIDMSTTDLIESHTDTARRLCSIPPSHGVESMSSCITERGNQPFRDALFLIGSQLDPYSCLFALHHFIVCLSDNHINANHDL